MFRLPLSAVGRGASNRLEDRAYGPGRGASVALAAAVARSAFRIRGVMEAMPTAYEGRLARLELVGGDGQ
jgi:hypothetical protein